MHCSVLKNHDSTNIVLPLKSISWIYHLSSINTRIRWEILNADIKQFVIGFHVVKILKTVSVFTCIPLYVMIKIIITNYNFILSLDNVFFLFWIYLLFVSFMSNMLVSKFELARIFFFFLEIITCNNFLKNALEL